MLSRQDDLELETLRLLSDPAVVQARDGGRRLLLSTVPHASAESRRRFDAATGEMTYFGVMNGLNDDPAYPRVTIVQRPGRNIGGRQVPAPKGMDENPDTVYRIVPMDGRSTYRLSGHTVGDRPLVNEFSLLGDDWTTVGNLSGETIEIDSAGNFTITIDPGPAKGRANHIQTRDGASFMVVRDTIADWKRQRPNALDVERLDGPLSPPRSEDARIRAVVAKINRFFAETVRLHDLAFKQPPNFFPQPIIRTEYGMLITQAYSVGRFRLSPGEALVLNLHPGTAGYMTVPITNIWGTTGDPVHCVSSLNMLQAEPSGDGSFTFVISASDYGFRNWVDTEGLDEGFIFLRWAAMSGQVSGVSRPRVIAEVVGADDVRNAYYDHHPKVDQAWRTRQLDDRARDYALRWTMPA